MVNVWVALTKSWGEFHFRYLGILFPKCARNLEWYLQCLDTTYIVYIILSGDKYLTVNRQISYSQQKNILKSTGKALA